MLLQIFKAVLFTSCIGSILAVLLAAVKPLTRKYFSGSWNYYIWLVVLIAMVLPITFGLPEKSTVPPAAPIQNAATGSAHSGQSEIAAPNSAPILSGNFKAAKAIVSNKIDILCRIWLAGAVFFFCMKLSAYVISLQKISRNSKVISCPLLLELTNKRIAVRAGDGLGAPLMIGLFTPVLLLPNAPLPAEDLSNILRHELTHFKRRDIWYKWFSMIVKCMHWFNPAVYFITRQINVECEISCDLAVVSKMSKQEETSYINTILSLLSGPKTKNILLMTGMANNKKQLIRRFNMIRNQTKRSKLSSGVSVIAALVILSATLFSSGVLSSAAGIYEKYRIEVTKFGQAVDFANKPFMENDTLYLPLRETLNLSDGIAEITWEKNGELAIALFDKDSKRIKENGDMIYARMYYYKIKIGTPKVYGAENFACKPKAPPLLKNNIAYVPAEFINGIKAESGLLNGFHARENKPQLF